VRGLRRRSAPTPRRVQVAQWNAWNARTLAALGRGDSEETYRQAAGLLKTALTILGIDWWPFDLARLQLAHGAPLRRTRAPTVSRAHLTAALETVEHLDSQSFPSSDIWRFIEMNENTTGKVTNGMLMAAAEAVAGQADVSAPGASLLPAVATNCATASIG